MLVEITVLEEVKREVKKVGKIIANRIYEVKEITYKGKIDLVTEVDVLVENELKRSLSKLIPDSHFLGEETSNNTKLKDYTWIVDPLDGTVNYAHGIPIVAVSVALWKDDGVKLGVVYLPFTDEMFYALKDKGSFLNNKRISVSAQKDLGQSLIATGFPYDVYERGDEVVAVLKKVLTNAQGVRRMGSAAVDLVYVACGRFDGFYEMGLKPWDTSAGWLIVEEAGGVVTQFDHNVPYNVFAPTILATNGFIHKALSEVIMG